MSEKTKTKGRRRAGQILPPSGERRSWALRFHAYGKRRHVSLGTPEDGWNRERVEAALRHTLADVERGIWQPYKPEQVEAPEEEPTFHEFATEWLEARKPELRPRTVEDYEWALSYHLLPFFAAHRLSEITITEVDRYRTAKVRQGKLSANSINRTIGRLAQILELAVEYGHLPSNPAAGRRRRLRGSTPKRRWLDPEHVGPLLAAAGELDAEAREEDARGRRAMLATLIFAGLRIGELLALRWGDVDLASGRIVVGDSKTDAGRRTVEMSPDLREELTTHKIGSAFAGDGDHVFTTNAGKAQNRHNVRGRVLLRSVERANSSGAALPEGLTFHAMRHTFASLLFEAGATVPYVMAQLGHADPKVTLSIYAHVLRRDEADIGTRLDELVRGRSQAEQGRIGRGEERNAPTV